MRLRTRYQFQRMAQSSFKRTGEWIIVAIRPIQDHPSKLGILVTKRYGSSPQRNRFKRLVRESFRLLYPEILTSCDILVRPRSKALNANLKDIQEELRKFMQQFIS